VQIAEVIVDITMHGAFPGKTVRFTVRSAQHAVREPKQTKLSAQPAEFFRESEETIGVGVPFQNQPVNYWRILLLEC
jgi:hypothetical protein